MALQVLIVQSDPPAAQLLVEFFRERGDQIHLTSDLQSVQTFLATRPRIALALVDLHLPGDTWLEVIQLLRRQSADTRIIVTNRYPDFHRELLAKEHGIRVFLRQPFSRRWIARALDRVFETFAADSAAAETLELPPVRTPLRVKVSLALALAALGGAVVACLPNYLPVPHLQTVLLLIVLIAVVVSVGLYAAERMAGSLRQLASAAAAVAQGNLEVKVSPVGNDELALAVHAFNNMISGLQESSIYRDLLGQTAPAAARDDLRQAFVSGSLRLEGQNVSAAVMLADIRGFTRLAEREEPATVIRWLNEYFSEVVPIIAAHGGVVDQIEGDAILAFFGILPRLLPPAESTANACIAALEMLIAIDQVNARRSARGDPPFVTGIGISSGTVTAGGLGTADRFNYTILGETVNTAKRMESVARELETSGIILSAAARQVLQDENLCRQIQPLGERPIGGQSMPVYRLGAEA